MKKYSLTFLLIFCASLLSSYGGVYPIQVTDFEVVIVKVPANVVWSDDDNASCNLDCSEETKDKIEFVQDGKTLTIKWKTNNMSWNDKSGRLLIKLQSSSLSRVSINGSGEFIMKNANDNDSFEYSINGSGDLKAMINAKSCKGSINGSGNAFLGGTADFYSCSINGSGDVKAIGLKAKSVEVKISGSGDAEVQVTESLDIKISGSGDVRYQGDPKKIDQKISGSGSIKKV